MTDAETTPTVIDQSEMTTYQNSAFVINVSRELYGILKKKTTSHAKGQLKTVSENMELKARRPIMINICRKDGEVTERVRPPFHHAAAEAHGVQQLLNSTCSVGKRKSKYYYSGIRRF